MSFYTASVGAGQQQLRMGVHANNIANVNTYGFKAERPSFASLMYGTVAGIDEVDLPKGSGAQMIMAGKDFRDGPVAQTKRSQDYSIMGDGFFGLFEPSTGQVSYTRDGTFSLSQYQRPNEDGEMESVFMLADGEGRFVLNRAGGTIEVTDPNAPQPVGIFDFVNTDGIQSIGANRFVPAEKNGQVRFGAGVLQRGILETSNTELANELTKVIEAQRSYSYALKMVQTSDEVENTINGLRG